MGFVYIVEAYHMHVVAQFTKRHITLHIWQSIVKIFEYVV